MSEPISLATVLEDDAKTEALAQKERTEAFAGLGAQHTWREQTLHPFTVSREALFYSLRTSLGHPPLRTVARSTEAFLADAQIILYLCAHQPTDWRHLRADPLTFGEAIEQWADENIPPDETQTALILAMRILNRAQINRAEPKPPTTTNRAGHDPGN